MNVLLENKSLLIP